MKQANSNASTVVQDKLLVQASELLTDTQNALEKLISVTDEVAKKEIGREQAYFIMQEVVPVMGQLRKPVDELEMIVDKSMWPMPSYGDLLFEV